jgi:type IV pilus assembly protein PilY1
MQTGYATGKFVRSALLGFLFAAMFVLSAQAAVVCPPVASPGAVCIASAPLANSTTSSVKPNLMFILDDSSSMDYNYLPDEVPGGNTNLIGNPDPLDPAAPVALASSQCNGVAYNPALTYTAPVNLSVLSPAPSSSNFGAAPSNGYTGNNPINLATTPAKVPPNPKAGHFYYKYNRVSGDPAALSYTYVSGVVDTSTTFYKQCNLTPTAAIASGKFTQVYVGAAEQQNYANWYSYYRTRMLMTKTLAGQSFNTVTSGFRVGFTTIHDTGATAGATFLPIDDFASTAGGQKDQFYNKLYGISVNASAVPQLYTPLRGALSKAGRIFAGRLGADPMQYSCQQNFAILASDGYWNSSDDTATYSAFGLDNGTPVGDQDGGTTPRPMNGGLDAGAIAANTLADVAMYYYQTDLRNPSNCASGATNANLCPTDSGGNYSPNVPGTLTDNNIKPHMTTLTVGLSINGLLGYSPTYATDTSGDFFDIKTGNNNKHWPDPRTASTFAFDNALPKKQVIERVDDLWHAAVNGRGTYFSTNNPTTLVAGLKGALAGVANRLGYGAAGATASLAPIVGDNAIYVASYVTGQWTGNLVGESIDVSTGAVDPTPTWCVEDVAPDAIKGTPQCTGRLAFQVASDSRTIYFKSGAALTNFTYANLTTAGLQGYFDNSKLSQYATFSSSDTTPLHVSDFKLVNYLRGQTQYMTTTTTPNLYRERKATLGDVVDTQPVFVGKPYFNYSDPGYATWKSATAQQNRAKTVFVGANDGMLHAFNADTGDERWAYVPTPVMPNMYWLADNNYATNHHFFADGRLVYADVCVANCSDAGTADWRTILMGGLSGGGRGFYALDVTNPAAPVLLWEFTSKTDADLGYSFGNPLAVKKSNGSWVVMVSSGYDNVTLGNGDPYDAAGTGKGFLFVLDPLKGYDSNSSTCPVCAKIGTNVGNTTTPSGLGRIAYWADNPDTDATALNAYGGDLLGNLWRFDINANTVIKLATFKDASGNSQPITTRPELTKANGKRMVYVSTGKYLEASDLISANFKTQSVYAIVDDNGTPIPDPRALAMRTLDSSAKPVRTVSKDNKDPAGGWFADFPDSGERSNVDMILVRGTLLVPTNVPTNAVCEAGGYSWLNFFDFKTGGPVSANDNVAGAWTGNDLITGLNVVTIGGTPRILATLLSKGPTLESVPFGAGGGAAGVRGHRVGWREIFTK